MTNSKILKTTHKNRNERKILLNSKFHYEIDDNVKFNIASNASKFANVILNAKIANTFVYDEFCEYCKDMKIAEMFSMKLFSK